MQAGVNWEDGYITLFSRILRESNEGGTVSLKMNKHLGFVLSGNFSPLEK